jgi:hypothetical protein
MLPCSKYPLSPIARLPEPAQQQCLNWTRETGGFDTPSDGGELQRHGQ